MSPNPKHHPVTATQDVANDLLDRDPAYLTTASIIRDRYTSGEMPAHQFRNLQRWHVAASFRRSGLPLVVAKRMQATTGFGL